MIIFDYKLRAVYTHSMGQPNLFTKSETDTKVYFFKQPEGMPNEMADGYVRTLERLYNLGKRHKTEEIRKVLGV